MISFKDISESDEVIKAIIATMTMVPFWYVSFILFHSEFFEAHHFSTILAFCFVFIITSSLILNSTSFVGMRYDVKATKEEKEYSLFHIGHTGINLFVQIPLFSFWILICFVWKLIFTTVIEYYAFVMVYFAVLIILFLLVRFKVI